MSNIYFKCPKCGSDDVIRDAYASWNRDSQQWELCTEFDNFICNACGRADIDPEEVEIGDCDAPNP